MSNDELKIAASSLNRHLGGPCGDFSIGIYDTPALQKLIVCVSAKRFRTKIPDNWIGLLVENKYVGKFRLLAR